jgi:hypothetical protein
MTMPRRKVSTLLDDGLYRLTKLEALRQRRQISEIVADALSAYLQSTGAHGGSGIVAETWGSISMEGQLPDALGRDEDWLGWRD